MSKSEEVGMEENLNDGGRSKKVLWFCLLELIYWSRMNWFIMIICLSIVSVRGWRATPAVSEAKATIYE